MVTPGSQRINSFIIVHIIHVSSFCKSKLGIDNFFGIEMVKARR